MIDSIKQLLQQEAQAVLNIPVTDAYEKAIQLIVEQVHQKNGRNTGGTESRSNVHSNLPGFSHTGSYQFSLFLVYLFYNQFHRFFISVCYGDVEHSSCRERKWW